MKKSLFWRNVRYLALKQCAINILILMRCEIRAAQIKGKKNKQTNQQNTMLIKLSSKSFFLSAILHSADVCSEFIFFPDWMVIYQPQYECQLYYTSIYWGLVSLSEDNQQICCMRAFFSWSMGVYWREVPSFSFYRFMILINFAIYIRLVCDWK